MLPYALALGFGMVLLAANLLGYDAYQDLLHRRAVTVGTEKTGGYQDWSWRTSLGFALLAWGPILIVLSIVLQLRG